VFEKNRTDGSFGREDFLFDHADDSYVCPGGHRLRRYWQEGRAAKAKLPADGIDRYRARKADCDACDLRSRCRPGNAGRKVLRSVHEGARDMARDIALTDAYLVSRRERKEVEMLKLEDFLAWQQYRAPWLLDRFGLAETVFTPLFMRFWFLEYYEEYELPAGTTRAQTWREACLAHPAAQQVSKEEIVKLYYDYALGAGNGALPPGRKKSSFVFEPHWHQRPWPPRDKWVPVTDVELGLA
jgi:hypothetical protein